MPPIPPPSRPRPRPSLYANAWRWTLPIAIAVMVFAVVTGVGDTTSRPAWMFGAGLFVALVGVVSFFAHLFALGRGEVRDLEKRLEEKLDRKESKR